MTWFVPVLQTLGEKLLAQIPWLLGLAVLFTALSLFPSQACNPRKHWWRSPDLLADTHYMFIIPLIMPYVRTCFVVLVAGLLLSVSQFDVTDFFGSGRGPLGKLPIWAQAAIYVIGSDFMLYWSHRLFHDMRLWPFHAVHHSAEHVDWTTSYRTHPVNNLFGPSLVQIVMILLGISPAIALALVPFDIISAAWVHSNLNWTLGPLKYVIATPVFHRWHHGPPDLGGEKNFSPTFSLWDVLFGTFYMPEGQLPQEYGVDDPDFPKDFFGQMIVPFRQFAAIMSRSKRKAARQPEPEPLA